VAREKKTEDPRPAPVFDSLATGHWPLATRCMEWRAAMAAGEPPRSASIAPGRSHRPNAGRRGVIPRGEKMGTLEENQFSVYDENAIRIQTGRQFYIYLPTRPIDTSLPTRNSSAMAGARNGMPQSWSSTSCASIPISLRRFPHLAKGGVRGGGPRARPVTRPGTGRGPTSPACENSV